MKKVLVLLVTVSAAAVLAFGIISAAMKSNNDKIRNNVIPNNDTAETDRSVSVIKPSDADKKQMAEDKIGENYTVTAAEKAGDNKILTEIDLNSDTAALLDAIFDNEGFGLSLLLNSNLTHSNYEVWKANYPAILEFSSRTDGAQVAFDKFSELFPDGKADGALYSGKEYAILSILFSDDFFPRLTDAQKAALGTSQFR